MYFLITNRWLRPDISERTGLAVMEIDIPTGYRITNDVLRSYAQSGDVPTMRRAEEYGRKVVYYFDYVSIPQRNSFIMMVLTCIGKLQINIIIHI